MTESLLIVGASVRAAAQSAVRSGFDVTCADLFADQDTRQLGNTIRVHPYPVQLPSIAQESGAEWAMYTGALENQPDVVDQIAESCRLLGNPGSVLRAVRDPVQLHVTLREAGLPTPLTTRDVGRVRADSWLRKPIRSCGGSRIARFDARDSADSRTWYYQQFIDGIPHGAAYLAAGRRCLLVGITRQLVGCDWLGAAGFAYCGSIGPVSPPAAQLAQWQKIGSCLVEHFDLRGLFGVDAVVAKDRVWPVEVNPRYTASMEVIERTLSLSMIALHAEACREERLPRSDQVIIDRDCCVGKAVIFADSDMTVSHKFLSQVAQRNEANPWPVVADIPSAGGHVLLGRPVVTVFANGRDAAEVKRDLRMRAADVRCLLHQ